MKKLFTNDKLFLACVILSVVGAISFLLFWDYPLKAIFQPILVIALYVSYKKHSKNVMKGLMGALLMEEVLNGISVVAEENGGVSLFLVVYVILLIVLFVNHFAINADHKASPGMVKMNQITASLIVVVIIAWCIFDIIVMPNFEIIARSIVNIICYPCVILSIVCVESRLDAYRLDREAAGWTEEKGYPEGYVHEFEKK